MNNCLISRPRAAPSARRTAISRSRAVARASNSVAILADAMISTTPATASSTHNGVSYSSRTVPETPVDAGNALSVDSTYACATSDGKPDATVLRKMSGDIAARWLEARSSDHPGARRPMTVSHHQLRSFNALCSRLRIRSAQIGVATSNVRPTSSPTNRRGATPMISNGCPSSITVLPIMAASPPYCRCQKA